MDIGKSFRLTYIFFGHDIIIIVFVNYHSLVSGSMRCSSITLCFLCPCIETVISSRNASFFYWRMTFRNNNMVTGCYCCYHSSRTLQLCLHVSSTTVYLFFLQTLSMPFEYKKSTKKQEQCYLKFYIVLLPVKT